MILNAIDFCQKILTVALRTPMSVTSWGRTQKQNKSVGGVTDSWHRTWQAVDVELDRKSDERALRRECTRLGLRVINEGDHYHIQPK